MGSRNVRKGRASLGNSEMAWWLSSMRDAGGEFRNGAEQEDRRRGMWSGGEEERDGFTGIGNCSLGRSAVADGSWKFRSTRN